MAAYPSSFAILNAKNFPHLAKQVFISYRFCISMANI